MCVLTDTTEQRILQESVQPDARQRSESIPVLRCAPTGSSPDPCALQSCWCVIDPKRETTMPDASAVLLPVSRDAINHRRLLILAGFVALALASMLTGIALSGS